MKEYKHSTKAGNHGDVLKHVVWLELLNEAMQAQRGCLVILDTHGGNGNYNIVSEDGESYCKGAASGIAKILKHASSITSMDEGVPAPVKAYLDLVHKYNKEKVSSPRRDRIKNIECYPGSPIISQRVMHPNDELICFELDESHCQELWERLEATENNTSVFRKDGLAEAPIVLKRVLKRKRPFVALIDPPYVSKDESAEVLLAIEKLHKAQSDVTVMLWIPIMSPSSSNTAEMEKLYEDLIVFIESKSIPALVASLRVGRTDGLVGSRVVIFNPPCPKLAPRLESALPWLAKILGGVAGGGKGEVEIFPSKNEIPP